MVASHELPLDTLLPAVGRHPPDSVLKSALYVPMHLDPAVQCVTQAALNIPVVQQWMSLPGGQVVHEDDDLAHLMLLS